MKRNQTMTVLDRGLRECKVSGVDPLSGETHCMHLMVKAERVQDYWDGVGPRYIQEAFPDLAPHEREFIMTGIYDWPEM